jgi:hypothetical protein
MHDDRPTGALFSTEGSSGWGNVRDVRQHKVGASGQKSEHDFSHLHSKFADPGDDAA